MLVLVGLRAMITDDLGNQPFELAGDTPDGPGWTHRALAEVVAERLTTGAIGGDGADRATRVAEAGLGLWLHDRCEGTQLHEDTFPGAWSSIDGAPASAMTTAVLLAPHAPDEARRSFEAASTIDAAGTTAGDALAVAAQALLLAREWGDAPAAEAAVTAAHAAAERLGADHDDLAGLVQRAELAAWAWWAAADAGGLGQWADRCGERRPTEAQLTEVGFPALVLRRAEWHNGFLNLRLAPRRADRATFTSFALVGAEPRVWWISGADNVTVEMTARVVTVAVPLIDAALEFAPSSY